MSGVSGKPPPIASNKPPEDDNDSPEGSRHDVPHRRDDEFQHIRRAVFADIEGRGQPSSGLARAQGVSAHRSRLRAAPKGRRAQSRVPAAYPPLETTNAYRQYVVRSADICWQEAAALLADHRVGTLPDTTGNYPRDIAIWRHDGKLWVLGARLSDDAETLFQRVVRSMETTRRSGHGPDDIRVPTVCRNYLGNSRQYDTTAIVEFARNNKIEVHRGISFLEGGNVILSYDRNRHVQALIGEDCVFATHMMLRMRNAFKSKVIASRIDAIAADLEITDEALGMYTELLMRQGLLEVSDLDLLDFPSEMECINARSDPVYREQTRRFLAEIEYVRNSVIPYDLGLPAQRCTYLTQPAYHLDAMMTPGPHGEMFVHDYDLTTEMLDALLEDTPYLTDQQRALLEDYRNEAQRLASVMAPAMTELRQQLHRANFDVIAMPGTFFDSDDKRTICFSNGLSGAWADNENAWRTYYLTYGAFSALTDNEADNVGPLLMHAFASFMSQHVDEVHFLGENDDAYKSVTESFNETGAGIHCATFSLGPLSGRPVDSE